MRTAVDTNIISALWSSEPAAGVVSRVLNDARQQGRLMVCGPVYAELLAHPKVTPAFVDEFLQHGGIAIEADFDLTIWKNAGIAFAAYTTRRRRAGAAEPKRLLVDCIIGSHAMLRADRLLTFDKARYSLDFPKLQIVVPKHRL